MSNETCENGTSGTLCAYEDWPCGYAAWAESPRGYCLYHSPENGRAENTAREVWEEARRKVHAGLSAQDHDFRGWHFPDDPEERCFENAHFTLSADFTNATFEGMPNFSCEFSDDARFENAVFQDGAYFVGAHFHQNAWFCGAAFLKGGPHEAGMEPSFNGATFDHSAFFSGATFEIDALFERADFHGEADFENVSFRGNASRFDYAVFYGSASFAGSTVVPGEGISFDLPSWKRKAFRLIDEGETAYRLAKEAARAGGDYTMTGQYHYAEQCAIEAAKRREPGFRPWRSVFWHWLLRLIFARLIFGYGEKTLRPLIAALLVIAVCAGLYAGCNGMMPSRSERLDYRPTLGQCLYFSAVTFTTLGYGDFQPKPGFFRFLAGAEAFSGAALMAVFIVGLTRKYMR